MNQKPQEPPPNVERGKTAFIGIDYDEWKPETYRGVMVNDVRFNTGDVCLDGMHAMVYAQDHFDTIRRLSSVDHFVEDLKKKQRVERSH